MSNKRKYDMDDYHPEDDYGPIIKIINSNPKKSPLEVFIELVVRIRTRRFRRDPIQFKIFYDDKVQTIEFTSPKAIAMALIVFRVYKLLQRNDKLSLKSLHDEYADVWGESTEICYSTVQIFLDVFDWKHNDLNIIVDDKVARFEN
ncbi:hypothetical protein KGF54_004978 [Candida jiufengensis]|uniref:uncharacterized protein n=1 Tax=Candida jiufengensis TaxID=497108 RepID=UPI00222595AF|nr:uncharacterized protein KGF54_004978 [Candida jiufengensis]KAI5951903.1 hypothetical protein KGF54_004978 [Candida jiufengensis]